MTAAASRILAVLVLGMVWAVLPVHGESLNRESDRPSNFVSRFALGVFGGANQGAGGPRVFPETMPTSVTGAQPAGWVVGAFVEADLTTRFSVQAGMSYGRSYGWNRLEVVQDLAIHLGIAPGVMYSSQSVGDGELPVTLNYRLGSAKWRPVIGGGFAYSQTYGVVAQFGLERRLRRHLTFTPLVRYFRWTGGSEAKYLFFPPPNQVQVLLALTF